MVIEPRSHVPEHLPPDLFGASVLGPVALASFIYEGHGLEAFCDRFSGGFCRWLLRRSECPDLLSWAVCGRARPLKTTQHFASDSVSLLRVLPLVGDGVQGQRHGVGWREGKTNTADAAYLARKRLLALSHGNMPPGDVHYFQSKFGLLVDINF